MQRVSVFSAMERLCDINIKEVFDKACEINKPTATFYAPHGFFDVQVKSGYNQNCISQHASTTGVLVAEFNDLQAFSDFSNHIITSCPSVLPHNNRWNIQLIHSSLGVIDNSLQLLESGEFIAYEPFTDLPKIEMPEIWEIRHFSEEGVVLKPIDPNNPESEDERYMPN